VRNEIRVSSLFRGIAADIFEEKVRPLFHLLQAEWGVPFEVANDGDVTALAGSLALGRHGILGISMGTSLAAGYVTRHGGVTPRLSELAFAPVDYRADAPIDEWSGDHGCGVQFFSQQGVARLAPLAGIDLPSEMPFAERLSEIQRLHSSGDEAAASIFRTIGINFGYALAHYTDFYDFEYVQLLGRVTSGEGGSTIVEEATRVLKEEFPELATKISIVIPNEKEKRHGQAIAAASLPPRPS
jgi:predicted NBD/HSP70 family sugar kinase